MPIVWGMTRMYYYFNMNRNKWMWGETHREIILINVLFEIKINLVYSPVCCAIVALSYSFYGLFTFCIS